MAGWRWRVEPLIPDGTESGEIKGVARRKERVWRIERSEVTVVRQGRFLD